MRTVAIHVATLGAAASLLVGCEQKASETPGVSVEDVEEKPSAWVGRQVVLSGEVDTVYGDRAFELQSEEDPFEIWEEELLVLTKSPIDLPGSPLADDDDLVVTGTVRNFAVEDLERELGYDIPEGLETQFRFTPVVVASSLARVEPMARWTEGKDPEVLSFAVVTVTDPIEALEGKTIAFKAMPVYWVTKSALWVGPHHTQQLLVVPDDPSKLTELEEGDRVSLRGYVKASSLTKVEKASEPDQASAAGGSPEAEGVPYSAFARAPQDYQNQMVTGEAKVVQVISDRAFWLESGNQKVLGIVREDVPSHEMIDIDAGQTVRFTARAVNAETAEAEIDGTLEKDAKDAIKTQPTVLAMHWKKVQILR